MTGKEIRSSRDFLRRTQSDQGKWGIPAVKKQSIDMEKLSLISFNDTRAHDNKEHTSRGVHFFVDDCRFYCVYQHPERYLDRLSQYAFVLTPDFSLYREMSLWRQLESTAWNRWCGAYWQEHGLTVIPTISWSTCQSFEFCFDGIEEGSVVAVSTVGCRRRKRNFLCGYDAMLERIRPEAVICYGQPSEKMRGNLIEVSYTETRRVKL